MTETSNPWAPARGERAVMLTTFRRDGRPVPTPVGYGVVDGRLCFMTDADSGKVKRLRHTDTVEIAASTLRGEVTGPTLTGTATRLTGADADAARRAITSTNRVAWFFLLRRARRRERPWATYAVTATPPGASSTHPTDHSRTKEAS